MCQSWLWSIWLPVQTCIVLCLTDKYHLIKQIVTMMNSYTQVTFVIKDPDYCNSLVINASSWHVSITQIIAINREVVLTKVWIVEVTKQGKNAFMTKLYHLFHNLSHLKIISKPDTQEPLKVNVLSQESW